MSFRRIYGYGNNPREAFINTKINEIGHLSDQSPQRQKDIKLFLNKTRVKYIQYDDPTKLEIELFTVHNLDKLKRKLTSFEQKCNIKLRKYFGIQKLNEILRIYNKNNDITIAFKIKRNKNINKYKFLF